MYSEHGSGAASPAVAKLPRLAERTFARDYCYLGYLSNMMEELATTIMLTGRLRLWAGPRLTCLPGEVLCDRTRRTSRMYTVVQYVITVEVLSSSVY